jgi:hypothetical protein
LAGLHGRRVRGGDKVPLTFDEAVAFVREATASRWWAEAFPHAVPVEVVLGGDEVSDAGGQSYAMSYASQVGRPVSQRWVISMHPSMVDTRIPIHELAHCASPLTTSANSTAD